jgi:hypothetical protein
LYKHIVFFFGRFCEVFRGG